MAIARLKYFTLLGFLLFFSKLAAAEESIDCFLNTAASMPAETTLAEVAHSCTQQKDKPLIPRR
ncbi:hypothetical protein A3752_16755 [Oleiphilus sp. HI0081]|jgi:hypothetical protein|nr:hypothetical protein A3729_08120 [Oleiphilus sp. HI0043]KZY59022.1 hypothetical protein A3735_16335 [Oleiphilus sp. HI0061]KZY78709.1 hypothetical protein A3740_07475 [Oleiphilus sp. HI0068]KZY86573.1 hypothetical protein A3743_16865 [Oleiphilus sp. HI0072]KZY86581.1 hypothetical protein A3741_26400 [Oleiphilus sp. HI0069]KZZ16777.1 hypothetical protein A3749_04395 [Oleiphilus sp. HI0078]KZZ18566.1 hypothetical protein A3752_16755 [Oleiphilus sp. HI0081]KZZ32520.1 hypothetical protein A37